MAKVSNAQIKSNRIFQEAHERYGAQVVTMRVPVSFGFTFQGTRSVIVDSRLPRAERTAIVRRLAASAGQEVSHA